MGREPSVLVQPMASLVPPDTGLDVPLGCLLISCTLPMQETELLSFLPAVSLTPGPTMLPYVPSADAIARMDYNVLEALPLLRPLMSCHGDTLHLAARSSLLSVPQTWYLASRKEWGEIPH